MGQKLVVVGGGMTRKIAQWRPKRAAEQAVTWSSQELGYREYPRLRHAGSLPGAFITGAKSLECPSLQCYPGRMLYA